MKTEAEVRQEIVNLELKLLFLSGEGVTAAQERLFALRWVLGEVEY